MDPRDLFRRRREPRNEEELEERIRALAIAPELWESADLLDLGSLLLFECMRYGATADQRSMPALNALYRVAMRRLPVRMRLELLQQLALAAEERKTSALSLFAFLFWDPELSVVSTASLDIAVLTPIENDEPLTGPKRLLELAEGLDEEERVAGIYAGLLALGDRRIVDLVWVRWPTLSPAVQVRLAGLWSGVAHAPVIDLFVRALDTENEALFGALAGALARIPDEADPPFVVETKRKLPVNGAEPGPEIVERRRWSFGEYGRAIARPLQRLAAREREPRILPLVLASWGIAEREQPLGRHSQNGE